MFPLLVWKRTVSPAPTTQTASMPRPGNFGPPDTTAARRTGVGRAWTTHMPKRQPSTCAACSSRARNASQNSMRSKLLDEVAARELLDLAHAVAERVAVHEQLRGRRLPSGVVCQECLERDEQLTAVIAVVGIERREHRIGERAQRVGIGHRQQQSVGAEIGEPRLWPALEPAHLQRVSRLAQRPPDLARHPRPTRPRPAAPPRSARRSTSMTSARSGAGSAGSEQVHPVVVRRREEAPACARAFVGGRVGQRARVDRRLPAASSEITTTWALLSNPNRARPRAASAAESAPRASSSKKSPCSRRCASATARDFASSIANRLSAWPATMRSSWLGCSGLPDREERLDAALGAHRLHPDVVAAVDERDAERRALGPARRAAPPRRARRASSRPDRCGERQAVQVEQQRPPLRDVGERSRDALDAARPPSPRG